MSIHRLKLKATPVARAAEILREYADRMERGELGSVHYLVSCNDGTFENGMIGPLTDSAYLTLGRLHVCVADLTDQIREVSESLPVIGS